MKTSDAYRITTGAFGSAVGSGNNGAFTFQYKERSILCIASDKMGWDHVSVSIRGSKKPPSWDIMCKVKDMFWDKDEVVIQYHPAEKDYVNLHPGVLHLWKPIGVVLPMPPIEMV